MEADGNTGPRASQLVSKHHNAGDGRHVVNAVVSLFSRQPSIAEISYDHCQLLFNVAQ